MSRKQAFTNKSLLTMNLEDRIGSINTATIGLSLSFTLIKRCYFALAACRIPPMLMLSYQPAQSNRFGTTFVTWTLLSHVESMIDIVSNAVRAERSGVASGRHGHELQPDYVDLSWRVNSIKCSLQSWTVT